MANEEKLTACKRCIHHKDEKLVETNPRYGLGGGKIWYNQRCMAVRTASKFDPLEGKYIEGDFKFCRDVNIDGHCHKYEEK